MLDAGSAPSLRERARGSEIPRPLIKSSLQAQAMILIYIHDFALIISAAGPFTGISTAWRKGGASEELNLVAPHVLRSSNREYFFTGRVAGCDGAHAHHPDPRREFEACFL